MIKLTLIDEEISAVRDLILRVYSPSQRKSVEVPSVLIDLFNQIQDLLEDIDHGD